MQRESCLSVACLTFIEQGARLAQPELTMKKIVPVLLLAAMLQPLARGQGGGGQMSKVGDLAPDFKMQYFDGHDLKDVSLSEYRGKKQVVLAFYVFAFTGG